MELANTHQTYHVEVGQIHPDDEFNCRGTIDPQQLTSLAASIHDCGLQIPVILWPQEGLPKGKKYLLVAGYRRFIACSKLLNQKTILATVRTDLTDETARVLNFTENLERKDLSVLEEAKSILIAFPDQPVKTIAKALNRSMRWVNERRILMELSVDVHDAVAKDHIKLSDAMIIHGLPPRCRKEGLAQIIAARASGKTIDKVKKQERHTKRRMIVRPSVKSISKMLLHFQQLGYRGVVLKIFLYVLGRMTDEELIQYLEDNPTGRVR